MARIEAWWAEVAAAAGASALFGAMFLDWHGRSSGWDASPHLSFVVFLTLVVSLLQVVLRARRRERVLPVPGALIAALGLVAAALVVHEIVSPSEYGHVASSAVYAALACAAIVAAGGAASLVVHDGVRNVSRAGVGAAELGIAAAAAALLGSMFAPWWLPEDAPHREAPDSLSAWAAEDWLDVPLVMTAMAALGYVLHRAAVPQGVRILSGLGLAAAGLFCVRMVVDRIGDPPLQARYAVYYGDVGVGLYLGAGCCAVLVLFAVVHAGAPRPWRATVVRELRTLDARMGVRGRGAGAAESSEISWPMASGLALLVALSSVLLVLGADWFGPLPVAIVLVGALVGFVLARWWIPLLPLPLAVVVTRFVPEQPCAPQASECYGNFFEVLAVYAVAVLVTVGLLVGVAMRRLDARTRMPPGAPPGPVFPLSPRTSGPDDS